MSLRELSPRESLLAWLDSWTLCDAYEAFNYLSVGREPADLILVDALHEIIQRRLGHARWLASQCLPKPLEP